MGEASAEVGAWAALSRLSSPYFDLVLGVAAGVLSAASLLSTDVAAVDPRLAPTNALSVGATVIAGLSLAWRRTRPTASFAVFMMGCLVVTVTDHYIGLLSVLLLLSLYSLVVHGSRLQGVLGLLSGVVVFNALALLDVPDLQTSDLLLACALLVGVWALGDAIRSRRAQQAKRLQVAEQEATAARERANRAVMEERLRIARELHDVVAHSMSLIAVQAGVGGHVVRTDVEAAERALEIIAETSRKALTQTRSMLGLLRDQDSDPAAPPMQTIGDLGHLVADVHDAGVEAVITIDGVARPLDPQVELTAYRVVQESLTNMLKHSSATSAEIRVTYAEDGVDIEVDDPGRGPRMRSAPDHPSSGHGLVGLRERTRLLGGAFAYGPADSGGFRVSVHLPSGPVVVPETSP